MMSVIIAVFETERLGLDHSHSSGYLISVFPNFKKRHTLRRFRMATTVRMIEILY